MEEVSISATIIKAVAGFGPELMTVGGAGLTLAVIIWGLPKALGFFKKTAK